MDALIDEFDKEQLKEDVPEFQVGDTVRVSIKIVEGEKERIQVFQGTVIARKGNGLSETFSVHRVSYGEGMERVFYLHSPRVVKIDVVKRGDTRRSKLYHLRGKTGKAAKVKEKIGVRKKAPKAAAPAPAAPVQAEPEVTASETPTETAEPVETTSAE